MSPRQRSSGRKSFSISERNCAKKIFSGNIHLDQSPSLTECAIAIDNNSDLSYRTPAQLKAWIKNQINKKTNVPKKTKCKDASN